MPELKLFEEDFEDITERSQLEAKGWEFYPYFLGSLDSNSVQFETPATGGAGNSILLTDDTVNQQVRGYVPVDFSQTDGIIKAETHFYIDSSIYTSSALYVPRGLITITSALTNPLYYIELHVQRSGSYDSIYYSAIINGCVNGGGYLAYSDTTDNDVLRDTWYKLKANIQFTGAKMIIQCDLYTYNDTKINFTWGSGPGSSNPGYVEFDCINASTVFNYSYIRSNPVNTPSAAHIGYMSVNAPVSSHSWIDGIGTYNGQYWGNNYYQKEKITCG